MMGIEDIKIHLATFLTDSEIDEFLKNVDVKILGEFADLIFDAGYEAGFGSCMDIW